MTLHENIKVFLDRVKELEKYDDNDSDGYKKEFKKITSFSKRNLQEKRFPTSVGELPYNHSKNRYKDILPYDHSRVELTEIEGSPGSDYINANFINGATGKATYIASQGPQPNTVNDFWRMLWQYDVHVVIMACNEYEGAKLKCKRYWPIDNSGMDFGGILVNMVEEQEFEEFTVRILQATFEEKIRLVYQLHYNSWPDHGTPTNLDQILDMIALARQYQGDTGSPLVVHCSAGCGRTGTILTIDFAWTLLKLGKLDSAFSIFELVKHFRTQRQSIVQSEDQYVFVHMAVKELFERHLQVMDDHFYENVTTIDGVCEQETCDEIYEDIGETGTENQEKKTEPGEKRMGDGQYNTPGNAKKSLQMKQSQEQLNPPLPPPKPRRFNFKDSPTTTVIEQTIIRLLSESDIETENKPLQLELPKGKKMKNKSAPAMSTEEKEKHNVPQPEKPKVAAKPVLREMLKNVQQPEASVKTKHVEPYMPPLSQPIKHTEQLKAIECKEKNAAIEGKKGAVKQSQTVREENEKQDLSNNADKEIKLNKTAKQKLDVLVSIHHESSSVTLQGADLNSLPTESKTCVSPANPTVYMEPFSNTSSVQKPVSEKYGLYDEIKSLEDLGQTTHSDSNAAILKDCDGSDASSVFDSDDDNAPEVPKKNFYPYMIDAKSCVAQTYKGHDISFCKRIGKPKGPREQQSLRSNSGIRA